MEDVLKGKPGDRRLPVVVYLDDIAVFGDDQNQVMVDTLAVLERLAGAGFMINLKKSQIMESAANVLGHHWYQGGYCSPCTDKIKALRHAPED